MGFLDIDNTTKSYGSVEVLHKVDISVEEGEFLVLVGPSGCGKSTLLNMIAGLEEITSGEIRIKDQVMNGVHPSKRNIAMVFQSYALYPNMTVGQNITFGLEMHGVPKPEREKAMNDVAGLLQIDQLLDRKPGALSGGQRQRVAMGRALVRDPDVFLFDEPLSNLDAKLRVDMRTEIKKLHQKLGTTIVYVTHDQIEALTLSTRIAVMNGGYVQQLGTPQEIYDTPANIFVATFMGSPAMNVIPAKVAVENGRPVAQVELHDGSNASLPFSQDNMADWDGKDILLGIRPEAITDEDAADRKSQNIAHLTNRVVVTEPAGSDTFVSMMLGGDDVIARMRSDAEVRPGADFTFAVNMEKAVAFDPATEARIPRLMDADVIIIGSGMGGATLAAALAPSGRRILILERGEHLTPSDKDRDAQAIFGDGIFRPDETWLDGQDRPFIPGNYYNVGGNSKFYGAALIRYRAEDFDPITHEGGSTPGWPIGYDDLEPDYQAAEQLYQVRGDTGTDPTDPPRSGDYPHRPVPDEIDITDLRARLSRVGLHPSTLPLGVDIERWLAAGQTTWDAFPNTCGGKMDAENGGLAEALRHNNVTLKTGCKVAALTSEVGGNMTGVICETGILTAPVIVLAAGAVQSAALLLASANDNCPTGLANRSDHVGRNFMNHNCSAVLALHPFRRNRAVYQKTLMVNDFYLGKDGALPLGNIQMLGKITGPILAANSKLPRPLARWVANRSFDFYAMSEDLPSPESRVTLQNGQIKLDWQRSNWTAHERLVKTLKQKLRQAGFPIVVSQPFDRRTPSHQCGTARMGNDPATSVVDTFCRSHDHKNLFIVDASVLPTSAAVNPALTIAALALRAGRHITETEFAA